MAPLLHRAAITSNTNTSMVLIPSTCRLTLGDRAFRVAAAKAWNSLPDHVRDATSLLAFRRQLKTVFCEKFHQVDTKTTPCLKKRPTFGLL